jgi:hypothetical protein
MPRRYGGPQRHAFGADAERVAGVFDVAAGEHRAVRGQDRRADQEFGIWRVGEAPGLPRQGQQSGRAHGAGQHSAFGLNLRNRDFPGLDGGLIVRIAAIVAVLVALIRMARTVMLDRLLRGMAVRLLMLALLRLVDGVDDAEIMLGVLEVTFRHHTVATAGRVAAQLQVFLEQLLRRATDTQIRTVTVENMVTVERNIAALVPRWTAATAAASPAAIVPPAHALDIHSCSQLLSVGIR